MSMEDINADLNVAKGHLRNAHEAANAGKEIAHTIWETVDGLTAKPSALYLFQPPAPSLIGTGREVTPQDITTTIDTAATGYSEARAELSEATEESGDDHINNAQAHLNNAVGLLREGTMDATTQAKIIEANVTKIGEGVKQIIRLLHKMNDAAYRLEPSAESSTRYTQDSINSIEAYQAQKSLE